MASPARTEPRAHRALTYRPHLDGLRTVAVYLVVLFHAGLGAFAGGFIGVDVFFVLSGFLVTSLLLRDLTATGRVAWQNFYSRRVRRLLPAAYITLIVTAIVYAAIATPTEMRDAMGGFRAAFLYVANWHFIGQATDYFAADVNKNPVLHFWSLAVEEQFYLAWPLLLGGLYFVAHEAGRWRWWFMRAAVAIGTVVSVAVAVRLDTTNPVRAYYGTDARAYQLLAGALIALTPQLTRLGRHRRAAEVSTWLVPLSLLALCVVGTSQVDASPVSRGIAAAVITSVLIVALENTRPSATKELLSSAPFAYLGRISYGIYLWHWPVIVVLTHDHVLSPFAVFLIAAPISTALAALSFKFVEHPVRVSEWLGRYKTPVIATGLAVGLIAGLLLMPTILDAGSNKVSVAGASGTDGQTISLDWVAARNDVPEIPDCLDKPVSACTVTRGRGSRVLLMGDSDARMWMPTFTDIAKQRSWTFSAAIFPGCPWQNGLQYAGSPVVTRNCEAHQRDWYGRVVKALDPDVIILAQLAYDDPASPRKFLDASGGIVRFGTQDYDDLLVHRTRDTLRSLERSGRKLVLLEPIPIPPGDFDPLSCLSDSGSLSKCAYQATKKPTMLEKFFRSEARRDDIVAIDLDKVVCPRLPTCDPVVDGKIVRRDQVHLTATFARLLAPQVASQLTAHGIAR
jgi:peptidoglycan/LPS O-acetylase OafA/YrhL